MSFSESRLNPDSLLLNDFLIPLVGKNFVKRIPCWLGLQVTAIRPLLNPIRRPRIVAKTFVAYWPPLPDLFVLILN